MELIQNLDFVGEILDLAKGRSSARPRIKCGVTKEEISHQVRGDKKVKDEMPCRARHDKIVGWTSGGRKAIPSTNFSAPEPNLTILLTSTKWFSVLNIKMFACLHLLMLRDTFGGTQWHK